MKIIPGVELALAIVLHVAPNAAAMPEAVTRNATHGLQLSNDEKKSLVLKMYTGRAEEKDDFAQLFSVSKRTISRWTARRDKDLKAERDRKIAEMWLACYTEEEIAEAAGCSVQPIKDVVTEPDKSATWQKNLILSTYSEPDWAPPLYNVWKVQNKSNGTSHFGNSEAQWLDNLLYMYTEPFDIVVDPFAGGGSTIDVCKKRLRRYWVSDRAPIVERRDIRQWDILDGPPSLHKRWSDVSMLYLDPPYWKQAEGKYSTDAADLANMPLETFYATLSELIVSCADRMTSGAHISLIIQPTQWRAPDRGYPVDHVIDLIMRTQASQLRYVRRVSVPYESQQCTPQQVNWAKENREILVLSREIIVWEIK